MSDSEKLIAIGDVHGCARSMDALLEKLTPYDDRTFVFIGDYIDRGPDSRSVVDQLLEFRKDHETVFLRGNHEQLLLDSIDNNDYSLWLTNGGATTLDSYHADYPNPDLPSAHMQFYRDTRLYYETSRYFFVHAGMPADQMVEEAKQMEESTYHFLWDRSHLNALETVWEKTVVFGHTPRSQPIVKDNMIGIDTGCVFNSLGYGKLTAALLPETEFITQICLD